MHILIVEDEVFIATILSASLQEAGYKTTIVTDGAEAWTLVQKLDFDLFLLDRGLPGMDGLALLKNIKQHERTKDIPVVLATGMDDEASVQEGIDAGAYFYLTKPVSEPLLLTVVKAALDECAEKQALQQALQDTEAAFQLLEQASFRFRSLAESAQLAALLARCFPDPQRVIMGLSELLINAVEHGNLGISYAEKTRLVMEGNHFNEVAKRLQEQQYRHRSVLVDLVRSDTQVSVRIADEGEGFDWQPYLEFSADRAFDPHGRGIASANKLSFDSVRYEGKGNIVTALVSLNI